MPTASPHAAPRAARSIWVAEGLAIPGIPLLVKNAFQLLTKVSMAVGVPEVASEPKIALEAA